MTPTIERDRIRVEARLETLLAATTDAQRAVEEAMAYSALAGGKRLRAALALAFCRLACGRDAHALDFACAIEMVHAYSLIHDDLPCMDDDDLRPANPPAISSLARRPPCSPVMGCSPTRLKRCSAPPHSRRSAGHAPVRRRSVWHGQSGWKG